MGELTGQVYAALLPALGRQASTLGPEGVAALGHWLGEPPKGKDRTGAWKRVADTIDGYDSEVMRSVLAHPHPEVRAAGWRRARLAHDDTVRLLEREKHTLVKVRAILSQDLEPDAVENLLPVVDASVTAMLLAYGGGNAHRVPLTTWSTALRTLDETMSEQEERDELEQLLEVFTWAPLAKQALGDPLLPNRVRALAAQSAGVESEELVAWLASTPAPDVGGNHDRLTGALLERDDVHDSVYELLRAMLGLQKSSRSAPWTAREPLAKLTRRIAAQLHPKQVWAQAAKATSEAELMEFAFSLPPVVWEGLEYWRALTSSEHAAARTYRFVFAAAGVRPWVVFQNMPQTWDVWNDLNLAVSLLEERKVRSTLLGRLDEGTLARLRSAVLRGEVVPSEALWRSVSDWGGDELALARLVPVSLLAAKPPASEPVLDHLGALLAPVLGHTSGRQLMETLVDADDTLTAGTLSDVFTAAFLTL